MQLIPVKKARRPAMLRRHRGTSLAGFGDQIILENATIVSEGAVAGEGDEATLSGTTMLTIDLKAAGLSVGRAGQDEKKVLGAVKSSLGLHVRLMRIARREVERMASPLLATDLQTELGFRIVEQQLLVDIDLECMLARQGDDILNHGESLP